MEQLSKANPANVAKDASATERKRIPMSVPVQKLECPDIPGFHLHWFNGTAARLQRALDGGYEFVDSREIQLNNVSLGGDSAASGNTDMGTRVSVVAGKQLAPDGQPLRMVLMKIRLEYYNEDQKLIEQRNDQVASSLMGGLLGAEGAADAGETANRYVKKGTRMPELFTKGAMARRMRQNPT